MGIVSVIKVKKLSVCVYGVELVGVFMFFKSFEVDEVICLLSIDIKVIMFVL